MPKYTYTVVNKENKQLSGSINAPDEASARKELNGLGFSILSIKQVAEDTQSIETAEELTKYEFSAIDKNGKRVVGTIQGEDKYAVFKRMIEEYQFNVEALYEADLSQEEKEKAIARGVADLQDRLHEEELEAQAELMKQQQDIIEFERKQQVLKAKVEYVLNKVNQFLDTYKDEIRNESKQKIKYYVNKVLRIKNSTNLEYILDTCTELLKYLQEEEIFIHTEQRVQEKSQLTVEAKSMMMELKNVNRKSQDIFEGLRNWRETYIINNRHPSSSEMMISTLLNPLLGPVRPPKELLEAQQKLKNLNSQLWQYLMIWIQSSDSDVKSEAKKILGSIWQKRRIAKKELKAIRKRVYAKELETTEYTFSEVILMEIFKLSGWVLAFYLIYYYVTIYLNSKQIELLSNQNFRLLFQTSIIKYFFILLFLFVCVVGLKLEYFKRKKYSGLYLGFLYTLSSMLIILNF